jgi:hypothetical protein
MSTLQSQYSNNLFEVDRRCITWPDAQPFKSVIYVSFGSIAKITKNERYGGLSSAGRPSTTLACMYCLNQKAVRLQTIPTRLSGCRPSPVVAFFSLFSSLSLPTF